MEHWAAAALVVRARRRLSAHAIINLQQSPALYAAAAITVSRAAVVAVDGHVGILSARRDEQELQLPQNHWFYLLAEGSNPGGGKPSSPTCNNSTVTGIGTWKAGEIFYHSLLRKTSGWSYAKSRVATMQAAMDLYSNRCTEFDTVKAAWDAVSVLDQHTPVMITASRMPSRTGAIKLITQSGTEPLSLAAGRRYVISAPPDCRSWPTT